MYEYLTTFDYESEAERMDNSILSLSSLRTIVNSFIMS